jgi:hypothetical protein
MDGTLVDSAYDWRAIRNEPGIDAPSLIDALNGLEGEEREAKWRRLAEIEHRATGDAPGRRSRGPGVPAPAGIPAPRCSSASAWNSTWC